MYTFTDGYFVFVFDSNALDFSRDFYFRLDYERYVDPGTTALVAAGAIHNVTWKVHLLDQQFNFVNLEPNVDYDAGGTQGNIASTWTTVTQAQAAILAEGDTRFRRFFGEPETDPDDGIAILYNAGDFVRCNNATFTVKPAWSRSLAPAFSFGEIYLGRVVGCDSNSFPNGANDAAFPRKHLLRPPTQKRHSESLALHDALSELVGYVTAFDPNLAHVADVFSLSCDVDVSNANAAAGTDNTARALWNLIDTTTTGGVDQSILSTKQLMDAVRHLQTRPSYGSGFNHTGLEAFFTPYNPRVDCNAHEYNDGCLNGHVCLYDAAGFNCFGGDPHGSNIGDLAWAAGDLGLGSYSSFTNTVEGTPCMGPADNTWEFDGGYRGD